MKFQFHLPSKLLQPFVQGYLEADSMNATQGGQNALFPNGFSGIFFNFGNPGRLILEKEFTIKPISIYGQIDHHFTAIHDPGLYSLGVLLRPTVLARFLREDMSAFTNKAYDGTLLKDDLRILHQQLEESITTNQKLVLLDQYFTSKLLVNAKELSLADHAITLIHNEETRSIKQIAEALNFSQRYLELNFKKAVGISPKTYSRIVRFKRMEEQLKKIKEPRWQVLKFTADYHDQNHFIKDFKRFTGRTPSDYLLENFDMGRSYLAAH